MPTGLAARVAIVCAISAIAAPARADERRKVAVIDLSAEPEATKLRHDVYNALVDHWALRQLDTIALDAALQGPFVDEDGDLVTSAKGALDRANAALARFDFAAALDAAREGRNALTGVSPSVAAGLCADLAFVAGQAQLEQKQPNEASLEMQFVHRLDPTRRPDPVRYMPEIVSAYDRAAATQAAKIKIEIAGSGRAWIDGIEVGPAPATFEVAAGWHLIQLTAPDRVTSGVIAKLERDQSVPIDAPLASEELQVRRARKVLAELPDDAVARAGAMKQLAELLQIHDAVLIWKSKDGKLLVQTWRDRAPGFSALREHGSEPASELLEPLSPPKPPEPPHPPPPPFTPPPHQEEEPRWYQQRWVQASVAGGVIVVVVGAILWARHDRKVSVDPMGGF